MRFLLQMRDTTCSFRSHKGAVQQLQHGRGRVPLKVRKEFPYIELISKNNLAAASVAGLCAYFLGLTDLDSEIRPGPMPLDNAKAMKTYLQREAFQRKLPADIPTVWNGVTIGEELNDPANCPLRVGKRQDPGPDYATCSPLSTSTTTTACSTTTASICTETITVGVDHGGSPTLTASSLSCSPTTGCSVTGSTSTIQTTLPPTTTTFIPCTNQDADPGLGINSGYCVCSGSTFSQSVNTLTTPFNSCAYTTLPTATLTFPTTTFPVTTITSSCQVCTQVGPNEDDCTSIPNCTTQPPPASTGIAVANFFACPMIGKEQMWPQT
jgi:hypothetical protein